MATRERRKISAVDTAWLRMDRPSNLMMICGVLMFREKISLARLREVIKERFLTFERFRQRPVDGAFWENVTHVDIDKHVGVVRLPGRAGKRELEARVSRLVATPLPPARPLWQFELVENYEHGSAVIVRIHHCYADGIALVRVLLSMTDAGANGPPAMPFAAHEKRARASDRDDDPLAELLQPFAGALSSARKVGSMLVDAGAGIWRDPLQAIRLADQGTSLMTEVAKLALMGEDSPTRFKGTPSREKRVAWADPLPLDEVKTVGRALGASVNDVLLACVAGALRGYLASKGDDVDAHFVRALVPVNLRPMEEAYRLGNRFGLVFLDLPLGVENPVERLYAVRENMSALKGSYQPIVALGILAAMGSGPLVLQEALLGALAKNATAVMTNVPGPQQTLWLAGAAIDSLMFWVPQSGNIGMGVSIISYRGSVQFGVVTDRGLCPDPVRIVDRFAGEFEKLLLSTLMSPWPRDGDLDPRDVARAVGVSVG
jgi:WS/DGAT/MGAT family acyltransferase